MTASAGTTGPASSGGEVLRVANCSGFYGDRLSAAREMVDGGPIDVLTGDWLAELTMGLLLKQRRREPDTGYARTFLTQLEDVLADCLDRGIKIVSNAGGLNPQACARAVKQFGAKIGRPARVACVDGDDAAAVVSAARTGGWQATHLDSGEPLPADQIVEVASAYLGAWGIADALAAGADVVVTGRVSDASVIVGPAAWKFGWARDDWDALAGAVVAGHIIECGTQATGGNYSFFTEIADLTHVGFPIAEIHADGSAVITKHPGTGGAVTVETVTAQLLYEIDGPRYLNPDVVACLDTLQLAQQGPDRVRITGVTGQPAPPTLKVGLIFDGGWRSSMTFGLTGLDIDAKAAVAQDALWAAIRGGRDAFADVDVRLLRADVPDPARLTAAVALLTISVAGPDRATINAFSRAAVEIGLASYPGLFLTHPPAAASSFPVFWPTLLPAGQFIQRVTLDNTTWPATQPQSRKPPTPPEPLHPEPFTPATAETVRAPLGRVVGARSGDKAGNATVGLWARDDATWTWLAAWLTEDRFRTLLPEAADLTLRPWHIPALRAVGFTVVGLLGRGVAANLALDAQAKGLGEFLRARHVDLPAAFLPDLAGPATSGPAT